MSQKNNKDISKKEEWIPIYRKRLSEAITYAKGSQSMAEFARKCGLNPMTLSRAVNGTIKKPLDEETIRKIAECSDVRTEDILEILMRSNGWIKNDDEERQQEREQYFEDRRHRRELIQSIIMRTLFEDGYSLTPVINTPLEQKDPILRSSRFRFRTRIEFVLHLKGIEPMFWNFSYYLSLDEELSEKKDEHERRLRHETFSMINRLKDLFLRDMWEPEAFENSLYSIVLVNRELYDSFFKTVKGISVNNPISLILVDTKEQKVVKERFLPCRDGIKYRSFFKSSESRDR